jgi:hypothetical protein
VATPTNTGVRFEMEVWCDVKTGQVSVVGAEPRVRQLIIGVRRDSAPDQLLRQLLAEYGKPHQRAVDGA